MKRAKINTHTVVVKTITITNLKGKSKTYKTAANAAEGYTYENNNFSKYLKKLKQYKGPNDRYDSFYWTRRTKFRNRIYKVFERMFNER